ncbi:MAG: hypothetical protein KDE47_09990, partial [Caldilineaceae bacterium]|nr:hypothetical protein [Caldilineaceae bacterium]
RPEWETTPLYSPAYRLLSLEAPDPTTQHHLIAHLLGDGHLLTAPVVDAILQRAEGNPLFLREIVNTLKERGALIPTKSGWVLTDEWRTVPLPATIERAIQARLDQLSAPGREVIDRASVIGQEFDYELLEPLQADAIRHELDERLQELTRRQFIQQAGLAFTLSYAFTHGLIQETIYQKLAKEARQWLHRLLAQLLQRRSDSAPELLAYHYVRSSDRLNAIRYTLAAAQHSAENWANATALAWYDSALAKLDSFVVEPPTALEQEQGASDEQLRDWRVNALGGRAAVNGAIGHNEAAIDDYQQVLQLYGDQPNASPVDLAAYHRKLAIAYHDKGAFDEALAALDQGFTLLTGQQSAEVGRHHLWRGMVLFRQGEVAAALAAAQQGVAHFPQRESAADLRDIAQAYNLQGIIYLNLAQTADAIAAHEQSCAYYRQADYLPGLERATSNL